MPKRRVSRVMFLEAQLKALAQRRIETSGNGELARLEGRLFQLRNEIVAAMTAEEHRLYQAEREQKPSNTLNS